MSLDWDEELQEYFNKEYLNSWSKKSEGVYTLQFLEGNTTEIECSTEGYHCNCHGQTYESPEGLLRAHSKKYIEVFNKKLQSKLKMLAEELKNEEDGSCGEEEEGRGQEKGVK